MKNEFEYKNVYIGTMYTINRQINVIINRNNMESAMNELTNHWTRWAKFNTLWDRYDGVLIIGKFVKVDVWVFSYLKAHMIEKKL